MWWPAPNDDKAFGVVRTAMNRHNAEMARLRFSAITSADGYVNDADGSFDWAVPSDELHAVVNDHQREIGTLLLGRRMYEVMRYWETAPGDVPGPGGEFARIWRDSDKIIYSRTMDGVFGARTTLEAEFDPAAVSALKALSVRDLGIGGPTLTSARIPTTSSAAATGMNCRSRLANTSSGTRTPDGTTTAVSSLERQSTPPPTSASGH